MRGQGTSGAPPALCVEVKGPEGPPKRPTGAARGCLEVASALSTDAASKALGPLVPIRRRRCSSSVQESGCGTDLRRPSPGHGRSRRPPRLTASQVTRRDLVVHRRSLGARPGPASVCLPVHRHAALLAGSLATPGCGLLPGEDSWRRPDVGRRQAALRPASEERTSLVCVYRSASNSSCMQRVLWRAGLSLLPWASRYGARELVRSTSLDPR